MRGKYPNNSNLWKVAHKTSFVKQGMLHHFFDSSFHRSKKPSKNGQTRTQKPITHLHRSLALKCFVMSDCMDLLTRPVVEGRTLCALSSIKLSDVPRPVFWWGVKIRTDKWKEFSSINSMLVPWLVGTKIRIRWGEPTSTKGRI